MMNKYLCLILALTFFSCNSEKKSEDLNAKNFTFSYELDTVRIDAKGEFLFLNRGLLGSTIDSEGKLFTFNHRKLRLDIIDLDNQELVDTVKFEEEGPNGIGSFGADMINITDSGELYYSSFTGLRHIDANGSLKRSLNWDSDERIQEQLGTGKLISFDGLISPDGSKFYGTYSGKGRGGSSMADGLAIIDLNTFDLKLIEVPKLAALEEFTITAEIDGMMPMTKGDNFSLFLNGSKIIISQNSINGIAVYDMEQDSLLTYDFQTDLLPAQKPGRFERKVATMEAYEESSRERSKEPDFGKFMYDSERQLYYRISFLDQKGILSIFDEDFNLIHEESGLGNFRGYKFALNGKIYRFINLDDEMAFEVLTPTYTYD